jgi:hypothetical protein
MITLTNDDVLAIRHADQWDVEAKDGRVTLRLSKKDERSDGFESEARRRLTDANANASSVNFWFSGYTDAQWKALGLIIRQGDELRFSWDNGHTCQYMEAASIAPGALPEFGHSQGYDKLFCDELRVTVFRPGKRQPVLDRFLLTFQITPNNTARAYKGARQYALTA